MEARRLKAYTDFMNVVQMKGGSLLSKYKRTDDHVTLQCSKGHTWNATPSKIKTGRWCPKCAKNCPEKAREKFYEIVGNKGGIVITMYIDSMTYVTIKCFEGHFWDVMPYIINDGHWCPRCAKNCPKWSMEKFITVVNSKEGLLLENYSSDMIKVHIRCYYGHIFRMAPHEVKKGHWCPKCANLCPEQAYIKFINELNRRGGTLLTNYINSYNYVTIRCSNNHIFTTKPTTVTSNKSWCPHCWGNTPEAAQADLERIVVERKGRVHVPYQRSKIKVLIECEYHHFWWTIPYNIISGHWCPMCKESLLEREARLFLEKNNLPFLREHSISELHRKRYDFYFEYNGNKFLLELDGKQHFNYVDHFNDNMEEFQHTQNMDRIKMLASYHFGYLIIRIDYTQLNMIGYHIVQALTKCDKIYLSNNDKYRYLSETISGELLVNHSPQLAAIYGLSSIVC
jgi:hypothetical protein